MSVFYDYCSQLFDVPFLLQNGMEEMTKLQNFLGLKHSEDRLQKVLDKCSLKNLKAEVLDKKVETPFVDNKGNSTLYRKGNMI